MDKKKPDKNKSVKNKSVKKKLDKKKSDKKKSDKKKSDKKKSVKKKLDKNKSDKNKSDEKTVNNSRFAYVMLMFGGDKYLPGALTLAYSIRIRSSYDIVCMVTHDVSTSAINKMIKHGIIVYKVNYMKYKVKLMKSKRQQDLYSKWMHLSFTKWQCLSLVQYEKVLFLDADMLALDCVDELFELKTPAGVFNNPYIKNNLYNKHKKRIPKEVIKKSITSNSFAPTAACVLLSPSKTHLANLKKMIKSMEPFGLNSISGFDEQSISYYYSVYNKGPKTDWRRIEKEYSYVWKYGKPTKKIKIMDFFGEKKPWELNPSKYPDLKLWHSVWEKIKHI